MTCDILLQSEKGFDPGGITIYIMNSVEKPNFVFNFPTDACSTTVSLETNPFIQGMTLANFGECSPNRTPNSPN